VTIACATEREWQALCAAMGRPDWPADPRFATASDRRANEADVERESRMDERADRWEITRLLQAAGVQHSPRCRAATGKRSATERAGFFTRLAHPEVGVAHARGIPWRFADTPNGVRSPAPCSASIPTRSCAIFWLYARRDRRLRTDEDLY